MSKITVNYNADLDNTSIKVNKVFAESLSNIQKADFLQDAIGMLTDMYNKVLEDGLSD